MACHLLRCFSISGHTSLIHLFTFLWLLSRATFSGFCGVRFHLRRLSHKFEKAISFFNSSFIILLILLQSHNGVSNPNSIADFFNQENISFLSSLFNLSPAPLAFFILKLSFPFCLYFLIHL